jgi:GNAT superfamily N-acetyltransferase
VWTLEHGGAAVWLDELFVAPAQRGQGIGTALLREAVAWAEAQGLHAIDLEVEESRARVESLYRREGFAPHTRRRWVKKLG